MIIKTRLVFKGDLIKEPIIFGTLLNNEEYREKIKMISIIGADIKEEGYVDLIIEADKEIIKRYLWDVEKRGVRITTSINKWSYENQK